MPQIEYHWGSQLHLQPMKAEIRALLQRNVYNISKRGKLFHFHITTMRVNASFTVINKGSRETLLIEEINWNDSPRLTFEQSLAVILSSVGILMIGMYINVKALKVRGFFYLLTYCIIQWVSWSHSNWQCNISAGLKRHCYCFSSLHS